jgi:hypothetical protein
MIDSGFTEIVLWLTGNDRVRQSAPIEIFVVRVLRGGDTRLATALFERIGREERGMGVGVAIDRDLGRGE